MKSNVIINILRFILVIVLQIFLFNNIHIGGVFTPFIYVAFVIFLPLATPGWLLLISSFALGIIIDLFSNSIGIHSFAIVFTAFLRPFIININGTPSEYEYKTKPNAKEMGLRWYIIYSALLILFHNISLFWIDAFSSKNILYTTFLAIINAIIVFVILLLIELIFYNRKKSK